METIVDVIVDLGIGHIPRLVDPMLGPLLLQTATERFGQCVIPAVSTPSHVGFNMTRTAEASPGIAAKRLTPSFREPAAPNGPPLVLSITTTVYI